jgi:hypothetical protein
MTAESLNKTNRPLLDSGLLTRFHEKDKFIESKSLVWN